MYECPTRELTTVYLIVPEEMSPLDLIFICVLLRRLECVVYFTTIFSEILSINELRKLKNCGKAKSLGELKKCFFVVS